MVDWVVCPSKIVENSVSTEDGKGRVPIELERKSTVRTGGDT